MSEKTWKVRRKMKLWNVRNGFDPAAFDARLSVPTPVKLNCCAQIKL